MKSEYMGIALEQAQIGALEGEIPVGAVIVKDDVIISMKHNTKEKAKCCTKHAEILAIEEASSKIGDWRLNECDMYLTMEPCLMCCGALIQSRIKNVYYLLNNDKFGGINIVNNVEIQKKYNHNVNYVKIDDIDLIKEAENLIKNFFIDRR